ncbi:olfactory receptor 6X1-like [Discoglossus pictus]
MYNRSNYFLLLEFSQSWALQIMVFSLLMLNYIIILAGNFLIILLIWKSPQLHIPMYFFLVNLSFLEIWLTTTIIPKLLSILAFKNIAISYEGCITQCYFYFFLGSVEFFLLAVMAFDRYIAICCPLRYPTLMNPGCCVHLAIASWVGGFVDTFIPTILVCLLPFCGSNKIEHFFCDVDPLLKLACTDTRFIELVNLLLSSMIVFGSLLCITVSYGQIITTIFKIPSGGRWKSFSTCASHLTLVSVFYVSSVFMCLRSIKGVSVDFSKLAIVLNSILTPLLNPFIYTLRNNQVKDALKRLLMKQASNTDGWKK